MRSFNHLVLAAAASLCGWATGSAGTVSSSEASGSAQPAYLLELYREQDGSCSVVRTGNAINKGLTGPSSVYIEKSGSSRHPDPAGLQPSPAGERLRIYSYDYQALVPVAQRECINAVYPNFEINSQAPLGTDKRVDAPPLDISPILTSGASTNRVNLVFFGDGYTSDEKEKFIDDATKLAWDIAGNQTFATVRPLLNIFAAFSPSTESGIGIGGKPKDTVFGLYRDGTELRGVYTSRRDIARAACEAAAETVGCDYPILLGNDPRYGGLGGEFTIVTASNLNGPLVLRHELGHSIIEVGEEYDGGYAYFGVNAVESLPDPSSNDTFKWEHWLTSPPVREERAVMPLQEYAWSMLNHSTPYSTKFTSAGTYSLHAVVISLSGLPDAKHLRVSLDGNDLGWKPLEGVGQDRWHYRLQVPHGLSEGEHEVLFELLEDGVEGDPTTGQGAQLCSVEILEYGSDDEFNKTEGHISAYPTFSNLNETTYRPTNEGCLMRLVTTPIFCSVCIEGLWYATLRHVDLIDSWSAELPTCESPFTMEISLLHLAQFRDENAAVAEANHEAYTIEWRRDNAVLDAFANKTQIAVDGAQAVGVYTVSVQFSTDEVRRDPQGLLTAHRTFWVERSGCPAL
ncbi:hypothetical protein AURDEDRAFT_84139 [Auricularia subglabra TFB-10046 SS5]|nr:hypothetical protein AURDEDRAFT_84139 [Auricularia subglabra TFB-10046 SS5]